MSTVHLDFRNAERRSSCPVEYHRTQFRSTVEARWAVVFDILRIRWYYEHKVFFARGRSLGYRPDFLLPSLSAYVECKGVAPTERECQKMDILRDAMRPGDRLFVFIGPLPATPEEMHPEFAAKLRRSRDDIQEALNLARGWRFTEPTRRASPRLLTERTNER